MGNKKRYLLIAIVFLSALLVVCSLLNRRPDETPLTAQEIRRLPDPEFVAEGFLYALIDDNISLAKDLVIPEQQKRIDQWKSETQHQAFECSYNWSWILSNPIQRISWGSTGAIVMEDRTVKVSSSYGCHNNEQSMSVEDVIVKKDKDAWIIIDWATICETPAIYGGKETCHP